MPEPRGRMPGNGSECQRVREVYRYLPEFAAPYVFDRSCNGRIPDGSALRKPKKAYSSSDRALNAFAQLGALRLRTKRVMISIIDSKYTYTLAEATQTLSSQSDDIHAQGDSLWLGVQTTRRDESLCAAVLSRPEFRDKYREEGDERPGRTPIVINDTLEDELLKNSPEVIGGPKIRFFAAVPIRSRAGFDIGAYCVLDDKPRQGLAPEEHAFLKDMADTVMEHFEHISVRKDHMRGEKMVKGLGLFVEGQSTLSSWWLRTRNDRRALPREERRQLSTHSGTTEPDLEHPASFTSVEDNAFVNQDLEVQTSPCDLVPSMMDHAFAPNLLEVKDQAPGELLVKELVYDPSTRSPDKFAPLVPNIPTPPSSIFPRDAPDAAPPLSVAEGPAVEASKRNLSDTAEALKDMLARASNLIREAADVDGVVFFDTKSGGFGSRSQNSMIGKGQLNRQKPPSGSEDDLRSDSRSRYSLSDSNSDRENRDKPPSAKERACEVLAHSTSSTSTLQGHTSLLDHLSVRETFISKLLRRHPHGKIYAFDEEGAISSSEDDLHGGTIDGEVLLGASSVRKTSPRVIEGQTILSIFPGARFVMVLPLWDSQREQWFASAMLWTSDPTRVLTLEDDLTYMAAFGNSIMAEASRLDMVAADHTKTALISSISHELRSPLHGVLGSLELLQDTEMNAYQKDIVDTIGHCSSTLLDTLSNVLDYAKINNFTAARKSEQRSVRTPNRSRRAVPAEKFRIYGTISLTSDLDLASVTEDVMGGIYAGYEYQYHSAAMMSSTEMDYPMSPNPSTQSKAAPLAVILDVEHQPNWTFSTQPGAWKRILMNIFGNALKYTTSGLVKVTVGYSNAISKKSRANQAIVTLTITDTGKGIAPEFLERQVYTPFSQEDSLTPGAGLGLSIVHQIVKALDGKVEISSSQGTGTTVKVTLKLEKSFKESTAEGLRKDGIERAKTYTNGLELVLVGMNNEMPLLEFENARDPEISSLGSTISKIATNWFGMQISQAANFDSQLGDVFLMTSEMFDNLEGNWKDLNSALDGFRKRHIIVITRAAQSERKTVNEKSRNIHFLSNPIGPKKLADCFLSIFETAVMTNGCHSHLVSRSKSSVPAITILNKDSAESLQPLFNSPPRNPGVPATEYTDPIVLLVEDNNINMKILTTCMSKLKVQYRCAVNGQEAVDIYRSKNQKPDIIFMDMSMPVMNGFEAAQNIRAYETKEGFKPAVVVAVTGLASDESQREAYQAGINLFMSKPVPLKELARIVGEWREGKF